MNYSKYWLVMRDPEVEDAKVPMSHAPRFVHTSLESAEAEAERLCILHDDTFLIFETVACVQSWRPRRPKLPSIVPVYVQLNTEGVK